MRTSKVLTEKGHVLHILEEDGGWMRPRMIWRELGRVFGLGSSLNALRKNLQRCFEQSLVNREKKGVYHYRIADKGRKRLEIFKAKKIEESERIERRQSQVVKETRLAPDLHLPIVMAAAQLMHKHSIPDQRSDLPWIYLLTKRGNERNYLFYQLTQEQDRKEEYEKAQRRKSEKQLELTQNRQPTREAQMFLEGLELGRKIGKLEAEKKRFIYVQEIIHELLPNHLAENQKDAEIFQAILARHYLNRRWWDLLPRGYNSPVLPVRGPAGS